MKAVKEFIGDVGLLGFVFCVVLSVALCPLFVFYLLLSALDDLNEATKDLFK